MRAVHASSFTLELINKLVRFNGSLNFWRVGSVDYSLDKTEIQYTLHSTKDATCICTFNARPLPGCCGVLVVYYLRPDTRMKEAKQKKLFQKVFSAILLAAGRAEFGLVMMTQTKGSFGASILTKCNSYEFEFVNPKTGHAVVTYQIPIPPVAKKRFSEE